MEQAGHHTRTAEQAADDTFRHDPAHPGLPAQVPKKCRLRTIEDGGMPSNMLQNPSDPDVTYRKKAGEGHRGYVLHIIELVVRGFSVWVRAKAQQLQRSTVSTFCGDGVLSP